MSLEDLIDSWKALSLSASEEDLMACVLDDITRAGDLFTDVRRALSAMSHGERELLLARSVATPTHIKWCLASTGHRGLRVWLHTYKPWPVNEDRFAASIHDHRYSFVSAVLRGGIIEERWQLDRSQVSRRGRSAHQSGTVYRIMKSEIHSLRYVAPDTTTLLVQAPTEKSFSTVYDAGTCREKERIFDLAHSFSAHFP